MSSKSLLSSPQLAFVEQTGVAVALSHKQALSLYKKSKQSGISFDVLEEVYRRGMHAHQDEQQAFNRVNSFIAEGKAYEMDKDLVEKRGLWDNIHAKRKRIKAGSGEHMRKPGSKGAPTRQDFINSQSTKEEYTGAEPTSRNMEDPASRFVGTDALTDTYKNTTPGYSKTLSTIKRVVKEAHMCKCGGKCGCDKKKNVKEEMFVRNASGKQVQIKKEKFRGSDMKMHKAYPGKSSSSGGGGNGE